MADDIETRLRILEGEHLVTALRLSSIEDWRRYEEPRIDELVRDGDVAAEVRKALSQRSTREWSLMQKLAGGFAGLVVLAGGVSQLIQYVTS